MYLLFLHEKIKKLSICHETKKTKQPYTRRRVHTREWKTPRSFHINLRFTHDIREVLFRFCFGIWIKAVGNHHRRRRHTIFVWLSHCRTTNIVPTFLSSCSLYTLLLLLLLLPAALCTLFDSLFRSSSFSLLCMHVCISTDTHRI